MPELVSEGSAYVLTIILVAELVLGVLAGVLWSRR